MTWLYLGAYNRMLGRGWICRYGRSHFCRAFMMLPLPSPAFPILPSSSMTIKKMDKTTKTDSCVSSALFARSKYLNILLTSFIFQEVHSVI